MKKLKHISVIVLLLTFSYIIVLKTGNKTEIAKELNITLNNSNLITYKDSHDKFHGDGLTYAEIRLGKKDYDLLVNTLQSGSKWTAYPLSDIIEILLYGENGQGPYIKDPEVTLSTPQITSGYYFFNPVSDFPEDTEKLSHGFSTNVTIALFDKNNGMLYYYKYDS